MSLKEPATKLALEPMETRPRRGNEGPKALPSLRKSQDHSRHLNCISLSGMNMSRVAICLSKQRAQVGLDKVYLLFMESIRTQYPLSRMQYLHDTQRAGLLFTPRSRSEICHAAPVASIARQSTRIALRNKRTASPSRVVTSALFYGCEALPLSHFKQIQRVDSTTAS